MKIEIQTMSLNDRYFDYWTFQMPGGCLEKIMLGTSQIIVQLSLSRPSFRVKILNDWKKKLDNSSLKSNTCKKLILSELLEKDQAHLKKEYWNLYKRYLNKRN